MDQVILFDKSFQQRLQEYNNVLAAYDVLPVSALQKEWGFFLEFALDPKGWQAIWKIHRKTCEDLGIPFPSVVLVLVLSLDLTELTALVKVLGVLDEIHIPDKHHVPLQHLWPTKAQDKTIALNLQSTANALDMLRFFYNNLLMPWDYEDDDTIDWRTKHLEPRLRLYYDMKIGVLPHSTSEHVRGLISEAKRLQVQQQYLESDFGDVDDFDETSVSVNSKFQSLMELHVRMLEIKGEVDIFENPLLRNAIIRRNKQASTSSDQVKQNIWMIISEGTATEFIEFITKVKKDYPNQLLKLSPNLCSTLEYANPTDIFILSETTHKIKVTAALENGGALKGICARENTILTSTMDNVMLDFKGGDIVLENLTIEAQTPHCVLLVRRGMLQLNNCKLIGDGKSSTHQGIIVLSGAKLHIDNCEISKFSVAIIGNSGSSITMENTEIYDCNFGLKIYDDCAVNATKVTIRNCKNYGVCVETEDTLDGDGPKIGNFEALNIIPHLQVKNIKGSDNLKGDAVINQKSTLKPLEDLFENTVCFETDDNEDMDTQHDVTVIERATSPVTV